MVRRPNILANALYKERGLKLLVGSFSALFGSERGTLLRQWATKQRVALAWGVGPGVVLSHHHHHHGPIAHFRGDTRLLDVPSIRAAGLNASASAGDVAAFDALWKVVGNARKAATGGVPPVSQVWEMWGQAAREISPQLQLALPKAGECSGEWERCLGRGVRQGLLCVCYESEQPGLP